MAAKVVIARAGCLAWLLLLAAACQGGDHASSAGVSTRFSDDCDVPDACDIDQPACQRSVLAVTACVRGDDVPKLPPIRVITQSTFRSELQAQADKMMLKATPWDTGFVSLGLAEPGMSAVDSTIEQSVSSIAAYYSDQTKDVTIIEDKMPADQFSRMYVLSHELTHYLQDRDSDLGHLGKAVGPTLDNQAALGALVEGEATVSSTRVYAWLNGKSESELNWPMFFGRLLSDAFAQIAASPTPLFAAHESLVYPIGGRYIERLWADADHARVAALFDKPYTSFVDWVAFYDLVSPLGDQVADLNDLEQPLDCAPPLAPKGFKVYGIDSFGATGLLALLSRNPANSPGTLSLARQLRGDSVAIYATSSDKAAPISPVLAAWRLRFVDPAAASAFQQQVTSILPSTAKLTVHDSEVLVTASDLPKNAFSAAAIASCPSMAELAPPSAQSAMSSLPRKVLPAWLHR